jgi:signal transduction histidine kinase
VRCGVNHFSPKFLMMRLERRLGAMGTLGCTAALSALAVAMAILAHLALYFDGARMSALTFANIVIETLVVAVPLILYSRRVIAQSEQSRDQRSQMSRRLALAVKEAELANHAKSTFLANMSHELRTPLNAILGFSEVMRDQHLGPVHNPRYLAYAADIHASGGHLLAIINDVLDLSKIEAGKMTLDRAAWFELAPALSSSLAMLKGLSDKFGVRVHDEFPRDGVKILAVERMVRQILINLVGNAIKFTPEGGAVHLSGRLRGDGGCEILVRDTGVGMNAREIAHALTPFGQNENRLATKHDGTGLGLPLAKAMLELHGGSLTLESAPEKGTLAILTLPAERTRSRNRAAA